MTVGQRVEIHPATDAWMMGDRYGEVIRVLYHEIAWVKMDRSGKVRKFYVDMLTVIA